VTTASSWRPALHLRIANLQADVTRKLTTRLAQKACTIALETLNVVGMLKNHTLERAIADAAFSEIARQLDYNAVQWVRVASIHALISEAPHC